MVGGVLNVCEAFLTQLALCFTKMTVFETIVARRTIPMAYQEEYQQHEKNLCIHLSCKYRYVGGWVGGWVCLTRYFWPAGVAAHHC